MSRPQKPRRSHKLLVGVVSVVVAAIVAGFLFWPSAPPAVLTFKAIAKQTVTEGETLTVEPVVLLNGESSRSLKYALVTGPPGAKVNSKTGLFTWKPDETDGPATHTAKIKVALTVGEQKLQAVRTFSIVVQEVNEPPVILEIGDQTVAGGEELHFLIRATDPDVPVQPLEYRFGARVPSRARLDPQTGSFEWTAPETDQPLYEMVDVVVAELRDGKPGLQSTVAFKIHVTPAKPALERLIEDLVEAGATEPPEGTVPPGFKGVPRRFSIEGESIVLFVYPQPAAAEADLKQISPDGKTLFGAPYNWPAEPQVYRSGALLAISIGPDTLTRPILQKRFGKAVIPAELEPKPDN